MLLPGIDAVEGIEIGERVRRSVGEARPAGLDLTLSAGVAAAMGEQVTYDDLFRAADAALLRAKREGRTRVIVAGRARAVAA